MMTKLPRFQKSEDKLDTDVKRELCKALRSGEYKQGSGALKENLDGQLYHCCLGVLGEISGRLLKRKVATDVHDSDGTRVYQYSAKSGGLEDGGGKFAYLSTDDLSKSIQIVLSGMNDQGHSFEEIAYYIENNL